MTSNSDDFLDSFTTHPVFEAINNGALKDALPKDSGATPGRRQTMIHKETDLYIAVGSQLRVASLSGTSKNRTLRTVRVAAIDFEIFQLSLNSTGTLLAVAGDTKVVLVALPHNALSDSSPDVLDCKYVIII
jgi:nucleoporin NUP82